jgi:hypothetical protein
MTRIFIFCFLVNAIVLLPTKAFGQREQTMMPKGVREINLDYKKVKYISKAVLTFTNHIGDSSFVELKLKTKSSHVPHILILSVDNLIFSFEDNQQLLLEAPKSDTSFFDESGNLVWKRTYALDERQFLLFKSKQLNQIHTKHIRPKTLYLSNKSKREIKRATTSNDTSL